ncbi:FAD-dependent oxidoreductase [Bacillus mojavensis]|uniref:FAD-dependent oxidoreductase n=1 Tax=Bacillus mojavensis TaxID=72360 RepID=UPI002DBC60EC|nr:FAD-dependent oxidoreductase [Bacillus mojavensis]MEC1673504.1 FAD-dependent oxidoreductase [Bacillus mojavensis]
MKHILIAGGGIGGLSAAISLRKAGFSVTLCEAAAENRKTGAGILQPQNALAVLKELGVFEECCEHGFQTAWFKTFDKQGNLLFKVSESFLDDKLPGRNNILRKTLNDILIKHAEASGARILWGKKIVAYEETPEAVTAVCDDGEKMQADILAGFDGIHSIVRDAMLQKEIEKEFLGMGAWRFYIELPDYTFEDATLMYRSGETQIGVVPLAEHAGYVFVLQPCTSDYWDEEETRFDRLKEILSGFPGLDFVTKHMSKEHPIIFNKLEQVAVQEPWYKGRVVIGGDAAHAGAPTLAQGAAMAIEDAIVLSEELKKHDDLETAFQAYDERRAPRALKVQDLSSEIVRRGLKGEPGAEELIGECYAVLREGY